MYRLEKETSNPILLFVRRNKRDGTYIAPYTCLGDADYVSYDNEDLSTLSGDCKLLFRQSFCRRQIRVLRCEDI